MSSSPQAPPETRMFARVIGPFLLAITVTALAQAAKMPTLLTEFSATAAGPWITGALILLSGLVVIALHQIWRGAAAIIVSALGWLTAVKGLFLLAFPQACVSVASHAVAAALWWSMGFLIIAIIGGYLTYVGWTPAPKQPTTKPRSTSDIPRAA